MRKEYNDRWNAPLVNPGFTMAEYEARRKDDKTKQDNDSAIRRAFERHLSKEVKDAEKQV